MISKKQKMEFFRKLKAKLKLENEKERNGLNIYSPNKTIQKCQQNKKNMLTELKYRCTGKKRRSTKRWVPYRTF